MNSFLRVAITLLMALLLVACGNSEAEKSKTSDTKTTAPAPTDSDSEERAPFPNLELKKIAEAAKPIDAVPVPRSSTGELLVVEQGGKLVRITPDSDEKSTVIDYSDKVSQGAEQGLLAVALHPKWPNDQRVYIHYTDKDGATQVEEHRLSSGSSARAVFERSLLSVDQPYANHNGGQMRFLSDGKLYVGLGDGGSGGDPEDNAQNPDSLLGKLVAIDVDESNSEPTIRAIGLRNPWRFSLDPKTNQLWIADVGQSTEEEINVVDAKQIESGDPLNFGWRQREGSKPFSSSGRKLSGEVVEPRLVYGRDDGCSITGGSVYNGTQIPELSGWYSFADFCGEDIRFIYSADEEPAEWKSINGVKAISSFAQTFDGELLVLSHEGGIYQVVASDE